jgi:hypothetical protein
MSITATTIQPENFFFIERPLLVQQYSLYLQRKMGETRSLHAIPRQQSKCFLSQYSHKQGKREPSRQYTANAMPSKRIPGDWPGTSCMVDPEVA